MSVPVYIAFLVALPPLVILLGLCLSGGGRRG